MDNEEGFLERILILRITAVVCFFIAAVSVLESFIGLSSYWAFVADKVDPNLNEQWSKIFSKIEQEPYLFLSLNLYNIILWNGVIVCSIGVLRYYETARKILSGLLGFDMIVTITHLMWDAYNHSNKIGHPGWYITINAMQVAAIIALSHPKIVELTERKSLKGQNSCSTINDSDIR